MPAIVGGGRPRSLILTAMICAVSMTFIDMTIISIAVPPIQRDLGLSTTGVQWTVNAYLLTLAAVRNYAASLGIAVLGTVLVTMLRSDVTSSLTTMGVTGRQAAARAARIAQSQDGSPAVAAIPRFVRADFAHASQTVFLIMAGIMAAAALVALAGLRAGRQEEPGEAGTLPGSQAPHQDARVRP